MEITTSILPWLLALREEWDRRVELNMLITVAFLLWLRPIFQKQLKAERRLCLLLSSLLFLVSRIVPDTQ